MGISMHDRYYEPEDDDSEDFIQHRTAELLNTDEYDPALLHHFAEAISEASPDDQTTIIDFVDQGKWEELGRKLYYISHEYWERFAENNAVDEYNQGLG